MAPHQLTCPGDLLSSYPLPTCCGGGSWWHRTSWSVTDLRAHHCHSLTFLRAGCIHVSQGRELKAVVSGCGGATKLTLALAAGASSMTGASLLEVEARPRDLVCWALPSACWGSQGRTRSEVIPARTLWPLPTIRGGWGFCSLWPELGGAGAFAGHPETGEMTLAAAELAWVPTPWVFPRCKCREPRPPHAGPLVLTPIGSRLFVPAHQTLIKW